MTLGRICDTMAFNQKVVAAGNAAVGARDRMIAWSNANLSRGFVPQSVSKLIAPRSLLERMVRFKMLHPATQNGEPGFDLHDFAEYADPKNGGLSDDQRSQRKKAAASRWKTRVMDHHPDRPDDADSCPERHPESGPEPDADHGPDQHPDDHPEHHAEPPPAPHAVRIADSARDRVRAWDPSPSPSPSETTTTTTGEVGATVEPRPANDGGHRGRWGREIAAEVAEHFAMRGVVQAPALWSESLAAELDLPEAASAKPYIHAVLQQLGDIVATTPSLSPKERTTYVRRALIGKVNDDKVNGWSSGLSGGALGVCAPSKAREPKTRGEGRAGSTEVSSDFAAQAVRDMEEMTAAQDRPSAVRPIASATPRGGEPQSMGELFAGAARRSS